MNFDLEPLALISILFINIAIVIVLQIFYKKRLTSLPMQKKLIVIEEVATGLFHTAREM